MYSDNYRTDFAGRYIRYTDFDICRIDFEDSDCIDMDCMLGYMHLSGV